MLAVPVAFQSPGPVGQMMNLVQQQDCCPALSEYFRVGPTALPKSRQCSVWLIAGCIDGGVSELAGDLKKQRGLAYLTRSGQKLDSPRCRLSEPAEKRLAAVIEVVQQLNHMRIIIRL
jgi:hypothetical protein